MRRPSPTSPSAALPAQEATADRAMQGPAVAPVSAAENPLPVPSAKPAIDSPAAADGRRILSAAFVRVGSDGYLTVELHDGRVLALRDVTMGAKDYCGMQKPGGRHCGRYADIAAARPGGAPAPIATDPATAGPLPGTR